MILSNRRIEGLEKWLADSKEWKMLCCSRIYRYKISRQTVQAVDLSLRILDFCQYIWKIKSEWHTTLLEASPFSVWSQIVRVLVCGISSNHSPNEWFHKEIVEPFGAAQFDLLSWVSSLDRSTISMVGFETLAMLVPKNAWCASCPGDGLGDNGHSNVQ